MLERVAVCDAHEGPVVIDGSLYATSVRRPGPRTAILRIALDGNAVEELATGAVMANGMTLDADGRLVVCEQGDLSHDACISRIDPVTLERVVLADRAGGAPLSSPNDVVVAADGAIWFTDPHYGHLQGFRPLPQLPTLVHRWDPVTGDVEPVADGFDQPNGIAISPDGCTLYVTDSGRPQHVVTLDVDGARLGGRRVLAPMPGDDPDGLKVDLAGRIYVSCVAGVLILSPDGTRVGLIELPGAVNFAFGNNDVLYITVDTAVWAASTSSIHQP